jgi:hypothetical protein
MTVAEGGQRVGRLGLVIGEKDLDTDQPKVTISETGGKILPDLTIGAEVTSMVSLQSNEGLCSAGVKLHGSGFIVTPAEAAALGLGRVQDLEKYIRPYRNGRDLTGRPREVMVIDLFGVSEEDVRKRFPAVYQRVVERVKPERDVNNRPSYRTLWWIFGEPRRELRPALHGLRRYIVTAETMRHRLFEFFAAETIADNMLRVIASDDAYHLGIVSSHIHTVFSTRKGGWMGVGNDPRYQAESFTSFPLPGATDAQKEKIRSLAEELDKLRKQVIDRHDFLTLTKLYNVREKLISGEVLDDSERAIHDAGCVGVIHELHNQIDAAVADAYGWSTDMGEQDILTRLVALNKERSVEETTGAVRWLRPDYQASRVKLQVIKDQQFEAELEAPEAEATSLPKDDADLIAALRGTLRAIGKPAEPKEIAALFRDGGRGTRRVERGLQLLAAAGVVRRSGSGWFLPAERGS